MANDLEKRITAKMVLDSTGFNSSLSGVNNQLKLTQAELKNANTEVGLFGKSSEQLRGIQDTLAKQIELHSQKVDIYRDSIEKTTTKMNDNIKERDALKSSLENASKSYDEAIKLYGKESEEANKAKIKVDELTEEYKKKEKAIESNAKQINGYETNLNKANAELNKTKIELNNVNEELSKNKNGWLTASEQLSKSSDKLKSLGSNMNSLGDKLLKISAPIVGAGIASLKFASDFEDSMAKVSTISDEGQLSIGNLRQQILDLSDNMNIASTDIANNVYDALSAGQQTGDVINFVSSSTKLAKAGFAEASDSLDLLTTILNAYKMKSKEVINVSDLLIQVQNKGKVTVGELSTEMGKVIPTAVATNVNLQQLGAGYAVMTNNGIKAAESTTYINSMLNELSKTGTDADKALKKMSGKSFADLMKQGKSLSDVLLILDDYAKKNKLSLKDMFGSAEAGKAALVLSSDAGKDFNDMLRDMYNVTGETDKAFNKVTNTSGERLRKSLNELKNEAIRFGDAIAPIMEEGSELLGKITDKLNGMDEQQIKNIANITLFTVGLGGMLKIGGGVVSTVGTIAGGLSKLSGVLGTATVATEEIGTASALAGGAGGLGALAGGLGGAVVAVAPWLLAGVAVAGVGYGIYKTMTEETVPAIDLFADKIETTTEIVSTAQGEISKQVQTGTIVISEETKKSVGAYMGMDKGVTDTLYGLRINSTTITSDIATQMTKTFTDMGEKIKVGLKEKFDEDLIIMQEFYANSKALSDKDEADSLKALEDNYKFQQGIVDSGTKMINEILKKASDEKRQLTDQEARTINNIRENMKTQAVKTLSQNEIEAQIILQRMKDYDKRITAEQMGEHIKQLNDSRDNAVKVANDEYNKRLETIIRMRDESHSISKEQADRLIKEAERQKNGIIENAEQTRLEAIEKMRELNGNLDSEVDTGTGKILTWWDKLKRWWTGWKPESKTFSYVVSGAQYGYRGQLYENASGNTSFEGGFTTLHEKGYEVYNLPRGTRIYNHDASEDLVKKTAEEVASRLVNSNMQNNNSLTLQIDKVINNRQQDIKALAEELHFYMKQQIKGERGAY